MQLFQHHSLLGIFRFPLYLLRPMHCLESCFLVSKPMGFLVAVSVLISNLTALWSENVAFTTPVVSERASHAGSMKLAACLEQGGRMSYRDWGTSRSPGMARGLGSGLLPRTESLKELYLGNAGNRWVPHVSPAGRGPQVNQGPPAAATCPGN